MEEKAKYIYWEHSRIAPEVIEGSHAQSVMSGIVFLWGNDGKYLFISIPSVAHLKN